MNKVAFQPPYINPIIISLLSFWFTFTLSINQIVHILCLCLAVHSHNYMSAAKHCYYSIFFQIHTQRKQLYWILLFPSLSSFLGWLRHVIHSSWEWMIEFISYYAFHFNISHKCCLAIILPPFNQWFFRSCVFINLFPIVHGCGELCHI